MTGQLDLFGKYPGSPGFKREGTSQAAARDMTPRARSLRESVLAILTENALTADEVAERMGVSLLSIRPRVSELVALGRLQDTGMRRQNESGHSAVVWVSK